MKGFYNRLTRRWGTKTVLIGAAALVALCLGGGAVYAKLGGQARPVSSNDIELQRGLVGWWKLDGNAKDSTPYADNGTVTGSALTPTTDRKGRANSAYLFDGSTAGNYIDLPYNSAYNSNSFTVSAWLYPSSSSVSRYALNRGDVGATDGAWSFNNSNSGTKFLFSLRLNGSTTQAFSATNFSLNAWHHVVGVYDGTRLYLYTDGTLVNSVALTGSVPQITNAIRIGSDVNNAGRWPGGVDDLRVYNRALGAAEVKALYDQYGTGVQAGSGESGLAGWWKFDGNAKDSTPQADNGTVSGPALTTDRKGRANSAYLFNGGTDVISIPSNPALNTSKFTYSAWVRPTSFAQNSTIIGSSSDNGPQLQVRASPAGQLAFNKQGVTQICNSSTGVLPLNTWSHVVFTFDGGTGCQFYINGTQYSYTGTATSLTFSSLNIGRRADTAESFIGSIDDVRVYSRMLSASEVAAMTQSYDSQINLNAAPSNTTSGGNINAGLVGYWPFNGNAKDATPYSDNGTVTGATLTTDRKGRANSAYSFNGSSQITVPDQDVFTIAPSTGLSMSLWAMVPTNAPAVGGGGGAGSIGAYMIGKGAAGQYEWALENDSNTQICLTVINLAGTNSAGTCYAMTVNDGLWHHYVGNIDAASKPSVYVDGVLRSSGAVGAAQSNGTSPVTIGQRGDGAGHYFTGAIDDVRIYSRPLTAGEVQALYQTNN